MYVHISEADMQSNNLHCRRVRMTETYNRYNIQSIRPFNSVKAVCNLFWMEKKSSKSYTNIWPSDSLYSIAIEIVISTFFYYTHSLLHKGIMQLIRLNLNFRSFLLHNCSDKMMDVLGNTRYYYWTSAYNFRIFVIKMMNNFGKANQFDLEDELFKIVSSAVTFLITKFSKFSFLH